MDAIISVVIKFVSEYERPNIHGVRYLMTSSSERMINLLECYLPIITFSPPKFRHTVLNTNIYVYSILILPFSKCNIHYATYNVFQKWQCEYFRC